MSGRDPFPMQSDAAKAMESSVGGSGNDEWNNMTTASGADNSTPSANTPSRADDSSLLASKSKPKGDGDIYDDLDAESAMAKKHMEMETEDDDFLDRPLWESKAGPLARTWLSLERFGSRIRRSLYGDQLTAEELCRSLLLACTLFCMIGGYWLLRSLKDPVLTALCGVSVIPKAKMASVPIVLLVVTLYNHLLDSTIPKHQLFYVFGSFYFLVFTGIALLLKHPTIGLPNEQADPGRILGWVSYCGIESFGSVMVSLFWSFANSNIPKQTQKASYGVMVATAQVGSILGPTIVNQYSTKWGIPACYMFGASCMLLLQATMYVYISQYGTGESSSTTAKKKKSAGVTEGLVLFYRHNYVKGIFAISCLFMIEVTIVDYTMKVLAQEHFSALHPCDDPSMSCYASGSLSAEAIQGFASFMGFFGQATNTLSFLTSLLGTSAVLRYIGLRRTLLLFPTLCGLAVAMIRFRPTLYTVFGAMMALKAASYAVNNPTKELLYQPTSPSVRYKAKSWIDSFGARGSKATGSVVTNALGASAGPLVAYGSIVGFGVASFLFLNALFMGRKYEEYTATGFVVGEEDDDEQQESLDQAINQNENENTSCALDADSGLGAEEEGQQSTKAPDVRTV